MITLNIHHRTTYSFRQPVSLLPHRLMLRPRESRDVRLISSTLALTPSATVTWAQDVFGNAVAMATFAGMAESLLIDSVTEIQLNAAPWPVFDIAGSAIFYPFRYSDDEWTDLGALAAQQYPDADGRLRNWTQGFVRSNPTDTLSLLKDICAGVGERISYQSREMEGTQSPTQTLERGWGSCRDFAVLFVEAARSLGFGARIVSGYLYDPGQNSVGSSGAFVRSNPTDTLSLLKDICAGVGERISYQSREMEGTQSPTQTLERGWGSCRDFAVLFVEAARSLGFGARIVSGYLYDPGQNSVGSSGAGSTHAWAEVFLPGAGWITFDPTNRSVGSFNLVPVAVARDIRQAMPVSGSFVGMTDSFQGMWVEVVVAS